MTKNQEKVYNFFNKYKGHLKTAKRDIANRLNVNTSDIDYVKQVIREEETPSFTGLDDFAKEQGFNPEQASMVWYKGEGYSVAVKNNEPSIDEEKLLNTLSNYKYDVPPLNPSVVSGDVGMINIFDLHLDKLSFVGEGGMKEVKENLNKVLKEFYKLLDNLLLSNPHTIIFPIGNDFFNSNADTRHTKRGTPQRHAIEWQDAFEIGVEFYRRCIDAIINQTNIHIVSVQGNHDPASTFYLAQVLKAVYGEDERVTLDMDKHTRKYVYINEMLFGFAHGAVEKRRLKDLPTAMAIERPKEWGEAKQRAWILGDIHHSEEYTVKTKLEHNGVDILFFRPSCVEDEWHNHELWIQAKKSVSSLLYKDSGDRIIRDEIFF